MQRGILVDTVPPEPSRERGQCPRNHLSCRVSQERPPLVLAFDMAGQALP
jgi:hypothetical protein